jgi:hypothetical protein
LAQTIQPRSFASLNKAGKDLKENQPETEDNMSLLLSVFDSLNNLYDKLTRLNYVIQRKNIEQRNCECKEEKQNED